MKIFEAKNLTFGYNQPVKENFSFEISEGETVLLKGLNGSGKSTLIRTICGLNVPLRGELYFKSELMTSLTLPLFVQEQLSVLLTSKLDASGILVQDYFDMHMERLDSFKLDNLVEKFDVAKLLLKDMGAISDGEKQKVLLVKTLSKKALLYVLDEPTTFLDYKTKDVFYEYIKSNTGDAFLISTHDIERMEPLSNSKIIL